MLTAEDETAIHRLLHDMADAWARGDGPGYAAACTDDARYVTMSGQRCVGRPAIAEAHQRIFDTALRHTHLDVDPLELQPVAPGVVIVHGSATVRFPDETDPPARPAGLLTIVAVHDDTTWRLASFSNTPSGRAR